MRCSSTCSLGMMGNLAPQGIGPLCAPARFVGKADKPLIKLQKASQDGEEVGVAFTHTDQILSIRGEKNVTDSVYRWAQPICGEYSRGSGCAGEVPDKE